MPIARAADIARRVARILDAEPGGLDTFSGEYVPTIIAADVSRPRQRRGVASAFLGAGGVGFRSEIGLGIVNGRMTAGEILYIDRIGVVAPSTANIEVVLNTGMTAPTQVQVSNGDRRYGTIAPFVLNFKNNSAAQATVLNALGGPFRAPTEVLVVVPIGISLVSGEFSTGSSSVIIVRPDGDNSGLAVWFAWEVLPDVQ